MGNNVWRQKLNDGDKQSSFKKNKKSLDNEYYRYFFEIISLRYYF